jgi:hypothetical protein
MTVMAAFCLFVSAYANDCFSTNSGLGGNPIFEK